VQQINKANWDQGQDFFISSNARRYSIHSSKASKFGKNELLYYAVVKKNYTLTVMLWHCGNKEKQLQLKLISPCSLLGVSRCS